MPFHKFLLDIFKRNDLEVPDIHESGVIKFPGKINIYTSVDLLLADIVVQAYKVERLPSISFGDRTLNYNPDKSSDMWAHYEDEDNVIVGVHGANSFEFLLLALNEALTLKQEEEIFERFCVKYEELLDEEKARR